MAVYGKAFRAGLPGRARQAVCVAVSIMLLATQSSLPAQSLDKSGPARDDRAIDLKKIEFLEWYCFDEINRRREENRLGRLVFSEQLRDVARSYSRRMAEEGFFSHFDPQGRSARDRLLEAKIRFVVMSENLLTIKGYIDPVPSAVGRWMKSDGHRLNVLNPELEFSAIGVWISRDDTFYFTQIFVGTRSRPPKPK